MRLLFTTTLLLALAAAPAGAAEPVRKGRMPLAASERAVAREGARRAFEQGLGKTLDDERREIVLVERRRFREKAPRDRAAAARARIRAADVYVYDYDENLTRRIGVRLPGGEVESIEELPGVQLPLSKPEIERAFEIAYADPRVRCRIQELYRARTGDVLANPNELHRKAMVFHARSNPVGLTPEAALCGQHRCAQLLLFTSDSFAVEVIPIVDLSTGAVVQVGDF
jgi:hypothetical protein